MANPYGVQYGQSGNYYPQTELLPNFRRTPPPEVLRTQMQQTWNEDVSPFLLDYAKQAGANFLANAVFGTSLAGLGLRGAGKVLANPRVQAGIGALEQTKYGRPVVSGIRDSANHPYVQKAKGYIDWLF